MRKSVVIIAFLWRPWQLDCFMKIAGLILFACGVAAIEHCLASDLM